MGAGIRCRPLLLSLPPAISASEKSLADGLHAPGGGIAAGLRDQAAGRQRLAGHEAVVPKPAGPVVEEALPAIIAVARNEQDRAGVERVVARRLTADGLRRALGPQAVGKTAADQAAERKDRRKKQPDKKCLSVLLTEPAGGTSATDRTHDRPHGALVCRGPIVGEIGKGIVRARVVAFDAFSTARRFPPDHVRGRLSPENAIPQRATTLR